MRLVINDRCSGHGRCYAIAPDLVEANEFGEAAVPGSGEVPPHREDDAMEIVQSCPENAIKALR